jgi:HAD superfamily hydrolase (TIGR01509 family)
MTSIRALVFDFDGLILDTETSEFVSVGEIYRAHGHRLDLAVWQRRIGTHARHWLDELEDLAGPVADRNEVLARRLARHHELIAAERLMPGVAELVGEAVEAGLALAVASSSTDGWVGAHLERLGLRDHFACLSCRTEVVPAKPAPDVYLRACERLGVAPSEAVALEDSPHGVRSAKDAGMWCVAVPNGLTRGLDFGGADLVVGSLAEVSLADLAALPSGR